MLSNLPVDFMSSAADFPEPVAEGSGDAPIDDAPIEANPEDDTPVDAPVVEDAPAVDEPTTEELVQAEPADKTPQTEVPEELDEGTIKVKDREGKYKYRLDESRYKTVYGNHQLVQQATDTIGEPLTLDVVKDLHERSLAHERLWDHITSGDPAQQGHVLNEVIQQMKDAQASGETGVDPTVPFAQTVYDTLRDQAPEAYNHLRFQAARDTVGDLFEMAASAKDGLLFGSAQRLAATMAGVGPKPADMSDAQYAAVIREATSRQGIPFHTMNEMDSLTRGEDPVSAAQRRITELETQLNGRTGTSQTEQFNNWHRANTQTVNQSIDKDVVLPALASYAEAWKTFPEDYQKQVMKPLQDAVTAAIQGDTALRGRLNELNGKARRATSEQARTQIGSEIQQIVANRARLAVDKAKGPILKTAAEWLKWRSQQTNTRRAAAQTRTAPQGQSSPVRQSALPTTIGFKNGVFDSATALKQATAALSGR